LLKVDHQSGNLGFYAGRTDNAVRATTQNHKALEGSAERHGLGLINCMAHGSVALWNTRHSVVTRCSEDYMAGDERRAKLHLHNSFTNMLLLAPTVWGDHDMFHSADGGRGGMLARSKAMSGGPVYLSDRPEAIRPELIEPLCDSDGKVYRPLAPAMPLPDSAFVDPYLDGVAFRAAAPLSEDAAVVCLYNLTHPTRPVIGEVRSRDLADAWRMAGLTCDQHEGVVLYDRQTREAVHLPNSAAAWSRRIANFADRFVLLCAVRHGWALIGRADKYLSPSGVEIIERSSRSIVIRVSEPGEIAVWRWGLGIVDASPGNSDVVARPGNGGLWWIKIGSKAAAKRVRLTAVDSSPISSDENRALRTKRIAIGLPATTRDREAPS